MSIHITKGGGGTGAITSRVYNERVYTLSHEGKGPPCLVTFYYKPGFLRTILNRIPTGMNHQQGSTKDTGSDGGWNLIGVLFRHLSTDRKNLLPWQNRENTNKQSRRSKICYVSQYAHKLSFIEKKKYNKDSTSKK